MLPAIVLPTLQDINEQYSDKVTSLSCSAGLSGYTALELVLSIHILLTFSDQRVTFLLGILTAAALQFISSAGTHAEADHQEHQWGTMIPNWLQPQ